MKLWQRSRLVPQETRQEQAAELAQLRGRARRASRRAALAERELLQGRPSLASVVMQWDEHWSWRR